MEEHCSRVVQVDKLFKSRSGGTFFTSRSEVQCSREKHGYAVQEKIRGDIVQKKITGTLFKRRSELHCSRAD